MFSARFSFLSTHLITPAHLRCVLAASYKYRGPFTKSTKGANSFWAAAYLGLTLIELLVVLSIVAILTAIGLPNLGKAYSHHHSDAVIHNLRDGIYLTRQLAVTQKQIISFCPLAEQACGSDWKKGFMIFSDANNNGVIDGNDRLIEAHRFALKNKTLTWRASGGRNYLRYSPTGMARQFGRFHLCSQNNDKNTARALVINRQGRIRMYKDRNRDGIVEDLNGAQPNCPT